MFSTSLETSFRLEKLISYHHHLFAANPCTSRTIRKEFKCSGETEVLSKLVHDTMRKSNGHEIIRVVS